MNETSSPRRRYRSESAPQGEATTGKRRIGWSIAIAVAIVIVLTVAVAMLVLGGSRSSIPDTPAPRVHLELNMDSERAVVTSPTSEFRAEFVTANGGTVSFVPSFSGTGWAASFPAPDSGESAVVAVNNTGSIDNLAPGDSAFTFGAEFRTMGRGKDDGDNIVQRGLADDTGQFKLETDSGVVACAVKGDEGSVIVRAGPEVVPGVWYSAQCSRDSSGVSLTVVRLDTRATWTSRKDMNVGHVVAQSAGVPLSVGGKLTPDGRIAAWAPDQFNGQLDNAFLTIAR